MLVTKNEKRSVTWPQECLAGNVWRDSSTCHTCAIQWPGVAVSDNTWGKPTSFPSTGKLGMNMSVSQSVESDVCLWKNAVSLAGVAVPTCCRWMLIAVSFLDLRHSGAVCLRRTLPFGRRQVWQPRRLTQSSDLKGALQGLLNQDDKKMHVQMKFWKPMHHWASLTGWHEATMALWQAVRTYLFEFKMSVSQRIVWLTAFLKLKGRKYHWPAKCA